MSLFDTLREIDALRKRVAELTAELAGASVTTELGALRTTVAEDQEVIASYEARAEAAEGLLRTVVTAWDSAPFGVESALVVLHAPEFATAMNEARAHLAAVDK